MKFDFQDIAGMTLLLFILIILWIIVSSMITIQNRKNKAK